MNSNLVLLYLDEGINQIYTLPDNFEIIAASDEKDYYLQFTHESGSFKIYIVEDNPGCELIKVMQGLDPISREYFEDELCDCVTKEIANYIAKGYNKQRPIQLYEKIGEWYDLAKEIIEAHIPDIFEE